MAIGAAFKIFISMLITATRFTWADYHTLDKCLIMVLHIS